MSGPKALLNAVHGRTIFARRVRVLSDALAAMIPSGPASVLDIGAGNGALARALMDRRPELALSGVDVLLRPQPLIPVTSYDGHTLPFAAAAFDYALLVDVLHHAEDPTALLGEAARIARKGVLVKDHVVRKQLDRQTLQVMDWVGNRGHGVALPYNYLTAAQWRVAEASAGLHRLGSSAVPGLYPPPLSWFFGRGLHFLALLGR